MVDFADSIIATNFRHSFNINSDLLGLLPLNKNKIINDPVFGFISIPFDIVFDVLEHPYFQRLRRIRQLGLTQLVYPGAHHTRFQHALGATHLMSSAVQVIRSKSHEISDDEAEAASLAILLHDIGHGPFSHSLENSIIPGTNHEELSLLFMRRLNEIFSGRLEMAIEIFRDGYPKRFLHQLVSSQLDMDRLDYLRRDSFFTGVTEGVIGSDRIIKMLNVRDDKLVIDVKGIYSIEKFLVSRRLMYWQVYFHKTVISAENLLLMTLKRAKTLAGRGTRLFASPALAFFLENKVTADDFRSRSPDVLDIFSRLDDADIMVAAKVWCEHEDRILATLAGFLVNRKLFRIEIRNTEFDAERIGKIKKITAAHYKIDPADADFLVPAGTISNAAYDSVDDNIRILQKTGECLDIAEASDMFNPAVLSVNVRKYFLCYPKDIGVSQ
jgi:HD superfamily phosphohydrolase